MSTNEYATTMPPNKKRQPRKNKERTVIKGAGHEPAPPITEGATTPDSNSNSRTVDEPHHAEVIDIEEPVTVQLPPTSLGPENESETQNEQQVELEIRSDSTNNEDQVVSDAEPEQNLEHLSETQSLSLRDLSIEDEEPLSANLTRLTTADGVEVLLIGTAHFSLKSVRDVRRVIQSVQPTSVVLELCRERAFMLTLDEQSLLEQNRSLSFEKVRNAIAEKGIAHGLIYIMFIKMSASLTEKLGMAPGAEFRAGSAEAQKIPGCTVVFADRSLRTTIARAVASISLWQKMKLIYHVLIDDVNITQEDVEKCKDKDMLESLLEELGGQFPGFKRVLLDERNIYLAHTIYSWAQHPYPAVNRPRVVAIVGIGHVSGIVEHWGKTTDEQMRTLNIIPEVSRTEVVVKKTIKYCGLAILFYVAYRLITPSRIQTSISKTLVDRISSLRASG